MSSQRISRGFHRLPLLLISITLLMGSLISVQLADWTVPFPTKWTSILTNWDPLPQWTKADEGGGPIIDIAGTKVRMPSTYSDQPVAQQQEFVDGLIAAKWRRNVVRPLALGLAITIAISLAIYWAERTKSDGATKQSGGMTYRLGWALYWACLVIAGVWATFVLWVAWTEGVSEDFRSSSYFMLFVAAPFILFYGLGRAFRYVLSAD